MPGHCFFSHHVARLSAMASRMTGAFEGKGRIQSCPRCCLGTNHNVASKFLCSWYGMTCGNAKSSAINWVPEWKNTVRQWPSFGQSPKWRTPATTLYGSQTTVVPEVETNRGSVIWVWDQIIAHIFLRSSCRQTCGLSVQNAFLNGALSCQASMKTSHSSSGKRRRTIGAITCFDLPIHFKSRFPSMNLNRRCKRLFFKQDSPEPSCKLPSVMLH